MIQIEPAVIVEGKYDKIKLSSMLDTLIIATDGFSVFKDTEKQKLIRRIAEKRGILILTDSDAAGFKIRAFIGGCVPPEQVKHAYIPDILGKEKRKSTPSKEGKLGVEGMRPEVLLDALRRAGATIDGESTAPEKTISKADLYARGLSGCTDSAEKRKNLMNRLDLPEHLSATALLDVLNALMTREEFYRLDC
jgi:ribonuclease M5